MNFVDSPELKSAYAKHVADLEKRYAEVLRAHSLDGILLHSGAPQLRSKFDDQYWSLRPLPHFQHWLPVALADCVLEIFPGQKPRLFLRRTTDFWEQPAEQPVGLFSPHFDVVTIVSLEQVAKQRRQSGRVAFLSELPSAAETCGLGEALATAQVIKALDHLRVEKTDYERRCLAEANRIAVRGHCALRDAFLDGDHAELDLHLLYLKTTGQDDPETPYKNIVALGEHAATLHHIAYGRAKTAAQSLLLDAGAAVLGYASDITRTYVKGHSAAATEFAALIASVEAMQQRLCAAAKPGLGYESLHEHAHEEVAQIIVDHKLANLSAAEIVARGVSRLLFPHGLGHSLGLQCHDVGCAEVAPKPENAALRNTSKIAPHQTFTVEPGIYFIEPLLARLQESDVAATINWTAIHALKPFGGIRIEDDLWIGDANLTAKEISPSPALFVNLTRQENWARDL